MSHPPAFRTLLVHPEPTNPRVLRVTLNRPERLNANAEDMPREIREAVRWAEADERTHVIVLDGAGRAFCAGYDLVDFGSGRKSLVHPIARKS